jgi:hypothetical protein
MKPLSEITLQDAVEAYKECSIAGRNLSEKRLAEDVEGRVVLQRMDTHANEWISVAIFTCGYAYLFNGGESPERFEKNVKFNFILYSMGYRIYFKSLNGLPASILEGFFNALSQPQEK